MSNQKDKKLLDEDIEDEKFNKKKINTENEKIDIKKDENGKKKVINEKRGKIRIAQKRKKGIKGDINPVKEGYKNIDVTSGSMNKIDGNLAKELSPFYVGPVIDKNGLKANFFEGYWQHSKMWRTAGHIKEGTKCEPTNKWYDFREKGFKSDKAKRHPLAVKDYGYPECAIYNDKVYDYLTSRKEIYVPIYKNLIKDMEVIKAMKEMLDKGQNIMIIDVDGPPKDKYPEGVEVNQENWNKFINETKFPFGHGWVVAGLLAELLE